MHHNAAQCSARQQHETQRSATHYNATPYAIRSYWSHRDTKATEAVGGRSVMHTGTSAPLGSGQGPGQVRGRRGACLAGACPGGSWEAQAAEALKKSSRSEAVCPTPYDLDRLPFLDNSRVHLRHPHLKPGRVLSHERLLLLLSLLSLSLLLLLLSLLLLLLLL